jgi:hypothetical protein
MPRSFTLDEANALLPRLREILAEMQEKKAQLDQVRGDLGQMTATASGNGHLLAQQMDRKRRDGESLANRLNELLSEVHRMGCEMKGLEEGLIDFRSERDGRIVHLCWKLGEERITHWHELDVGFAGRQPL